jgi:hypothetical protein
LSDSTSRNESITEVIPKALGKYLLDNVEGLKEYYDQFPAPNMSINTPSVSILMKAPVFSPRAEIYPVEDINPLNITDNKSRVDWVVGEYEVKIQMDLWARNKEERDDLTDALFNGLNPDIQPMGLRLVLDEYFYCIADYLYVGHNFEDNEITAQTDDWRTTFEILVTCKAVRTRKEFIITSTPTPKEIEDVGQINYTVVVDE